MKKLPGFTVVEILIIIAVIGILFTIVTVAWSSTMRDSEDDTRHAEHQEWVSRFETYETQQGIYPDLASSSSGTSYCLGTKFAGNRCGANNIATNDAANPAINELGKVGTLPEYTHKDAHGRTGPWARYYTSSIRVYHAYYNGTCPSGTTRDTTFTGEGAVCYVTLNK